MPFYLHPTVIIQRRSPAASLCSAQIRVIKIAMSFRGIAAAMVSIWLAVNLLGCLTADDADLHPASPSLVATSFDTPDDLKHQSFFFPLRTIVKTIYTPDSLLENQPPLPSVSSQDSKPHEANCILLL